MASRFWDSRARWKRVWIGATAFALYVVAGFLLVPALVKWQLLKQLPPLTHRQAAVRQVICNPLALSLTVRGLALTETNQQPFAAFEEFYANFQLSSLFRWAWTFDQVRLTRPRAELVLGEDGRFNFANLIESTNPPAPPKTERQTGPPRILIHSLVVTNGYVGFADLTRKTPFRTAYAPINLDLRRFTTRRDRESPYAFEAWSESGRGLAWGGTVTVDPLGSSGTLSVRGFQLPKHAPYIEDYTRAQLADGTLDVTGSYRFALATNGMDLVVSNLAVTVANVELKDPDTGESVLTLPSYDLREGSLDWRAREISVRSLTVSEPKARVRRRPDGSINIPSLVLRRMAPAQPQGRTNTDSGPPWAFALDDYRLEKAAIEFEDQTVSGPFRTRIEPMSIHIERFTTRPDSEASVLAELATEAGETLKLEAGYSINPPRGAGALTLEGLDLKKYQPYLEPFFRGRIEKGKSDLSVGLNHGMRDGAHDISVSNLVLRVADLEIKSPDADDAVLQLPSFVVQDGFASLSDKAIRVGAIQSEGARIRARREADGTLDLMRLVVSTNTAAAAGPEANEAPARKPEAAGGWRAALGEFALRDYGIRLDDAQTPTPGVVEIDQLALALRGAQYPSNAPIQVEFAARVNQTGAVKARGSVLPFTPAGALEVEVNDLPLPTFQPWIDQHANLTLTNGVLALNGKVEFDPRSAGNPKVHFAGGVTLTNLAAADRVLNEELVRWNDLSVSGIVLGVAPTRIAADQVRLAGLKANAIVGPDKRLNWLTVGPGPDTNAPRASADAPAPAAGAPGTEPLPIRLGELRLEGAAFHLEDRSIQPLCLFDVRQLDGTVKGLSSKSDAQAQVDLSGKIDEASPFGLRGTVNPLARDLSLSLVFTNQNLQLTPFTPYLEKYAGHPLNRGRLSLDLAYAIAGGELKASNLVRIEQLMLGPRNESPDATKLPVKLAVALLKDSAGLIELDVPVSGRLDDPEFSVLPIVLKVIVNMIVKAAASPFKLLGALVGGGEELSFIEFAPGQAAMREGETNKLDKLIKALEARPALNLEIAGSIDPVEDRDALARGLVQSQVKAARLGELSAIGRSPADADAFDPEPGDKERLLRALASTTFGTNLTDAVQALAQRTATNIVASSRKPTRGGGVLSPLTGLFKSRQERAALAQARRQAKADAALLEASPELAALTTDAMEALLATRTDVPPERLRELMEARVQAVQTYLEASGQVSPERLLVVPPPMPDASFQGQARVTLSPN